MPIQWTEKLAFSRTRSNDWKIKMKKTRELNVTLRLRIIRLHNREFKGIEAFSRTEKKEQRNSRKFHWNKSLYSWEHFLEKR
jgi:hypothetical protein